MKQQTNNFRFTILSAMILLAAFSRIIPHPFNFSPLGAIGLFGAAHFQKKWQAFVIPVAATWLSDLFLNNVIYANLHPTFTWFYNGFYWQYASYLLITLAGIFILKKVTMPRVIAAAFTSTIIFFFISNLGVWATSGIYPQNLPGLTTCYIAALPFLQGTFAGDLFYSGVLFGTFAFILQRMPQLKNYPSFS